MRRRCYAVFASQISTTTLLREPTSLTPPVIVSLTTVSGAAIGRSPPTSGACGGGGGGRRYPPTSGAAILTAGGCRQQPKKPAQSVHNERNLTDLRHLASILTSGSPADAKRTATQFRMTTAIIPLPASASTGCRWFWCPSCPITITATLLVAIIISFTTFAIVHHFLSTSRAPVVEVSVHVQNSVSSMKIERARKSGFQKFEST